MMAVTEFPGFHKSSLACTCPCRAGEEVEVKGPLGLNWPESRTYVARHRCDNGHLVKGDSPRHRRSTLFICICLDSTNPWRSGVCACSHCKMVAALHCQ